MSETGESGPRAVPEVGISVTGLVLAYVTFAPDTWPFGSVGFGWRRVAQAAFLAAWGSWGATRAQALWQKEGWSPRTIGMSVVGGMGYAAAVGFMVWAGWTFAAE